MRMLLMQITRWTRCNDYKTQKGYLPVMIILVSDPCILSLMCDLFSLLEGYVDVEFPVLLEMCW